MCLWNERVQDAHLVGFIPFLQVVILWSIETLHLDYPVQVGCNVGNPMTSCLEIVAHMCCLLGIAVRNPNRKRLWLVMTFVLHLQRARMRDNLYILDCWF